MFCIRDMEGIDWHQQLANVMYLINLSDDICSLNSVVCKRRLQGTMEIKIHIIPEA